MTIDAKSNLTDNFIQFKFKFIEIYRYIVLANNLNRLMSAVGVSSFDFIVQEEPG